MPRIPGIGQREAVRVFQKLGFAIRRQGKHVVMNKGGVYLIIPRHTQIKAATMGDIAKTAGLSPEQFRELL